MACHGAASIYGRQGSGLMKGKEQKEENGVIDLIWILLSAVRVMMMMGAPVRPPHRLPVPTEEDRLQCVP